MRYVLLAGMFMVGCGARVSDAAGGTNDGLGGSDAGTDVGSSSSPPSTGDTAPPSTASDASAPTDPPPSAGGCEDAFWGAGRPAVFQQYEFIHVPADCPPDGSSCFIVPRIEASCTMWLQNRTAPPRSFTLAPEDCAFVKRMVTSDRFAALLKSKYGCSTAEPGPNDIITISLSDGSGGAVKFPSRCSEEPFKTHAACVKRLVEKYWPGTKL